MDELSESVLNALSTLIDDIKSGKVEVRGLHYVAEVVGIGPTSDGWEQSIATGKMEMSVEYIKDVKEINQGRDVEQ